MTLSLEQPVVDYDTDTAMGKSVRNVIHNIGLMIFGEVLYILPFHGDSKD